MNKEKLSKFKKKLKSYAPILISTVGLGLIVYQQKLIRGLGNQSFDGFKEAIEQIEKTGYTVMLHDFNGDAQIVMTTSDEYYEDRE